MTAAALLVVAKAPVAGSVKTRLSPPLTPIEAAQIAAAALLDTLDAVAGTPAPLRVVALGGDLGRAVAGAELTARLRDFVVIGQRGAGFAQRLANAHADMTDLIDAPVLQIGMDTPQLDSELLSRSAGLLNDPGVDAVLGPASDGGWWALGLRDPRQAAALASVPMSRPDTGELTRAVLSGCVRTLPVLRDVDTYDDLLDVAPDTSPHSRFRRSVALFAEGRRGG